MKTTQIIKSVSILFFMSVLVACSSSGGGDQLTGSGRVSLLLTDGPTTDFDQINLTLESISFLKDDEVPDTKEANDENLDDEVDDDSTSKEVILFEETRVVNLLALQNYSDLLATTTISAGTYNKIRLRVSQVELVKLNPDGTVLSSDIAKLPANGKIDLNPQGSFDVIADGHLMIELDVDANKSIHVVETGNGKFIFRPVIFVNILGEEELKLAVLHGRVLARSNVDSVNHFQLCDVEAVEVNASCLEVVISENTVAQNSLIDVVLTDNIVDNNIVTILGKVGSASINALHIVVEADDVPNNLALFTGEASSLVAVDGSFGMVTDDGNSVVLPGTTLNVEISAGARVFNAFGTVIGSSEIGNGSDVDVFGLAVPELSTVSAVKAAFVIVDNEIEADNISGTIIAINSNDSSLTVVVVSDTFSGDVCVNIAKADVFLLATTADSITSSEAGINDLQTGMSVDVYGEDEGQSQSCLTADVVLVTEN